MDRQRTPEPVPARPAIELVRQKESLIRVLKLKVKDLEALLARREAEVKAAPGTTSRSRSELEHLREQIKDAIERVRTLEEERERLLPPEEAASIIVPLPGSEPRALSVVPDPTRTPPAGAYERLRDALMNIYKQWETLHKLLPEELRGLSLENGMALEAVIELVARHRASLGGPQAGEAAAGAPYANASSGSAPPGASTAGVAGATGATGAGSAGAAPQTTGAAAGPGIGAAAGIPSPSAPAAAHSGAAPAAGTAAAQGASRTGTAGGAQPPAAGQPQLSVVPTSLEGERPPTPTPLERCLDEAQRAAASGDILKARALFHQALRIDRLSIPATLGLARVHEAEGDYPAAMTLLERFLRQPSPPAEALALAERVQWKQKALDQFAGQLKTLK